MGLAFPAGKIPGFNPTHLALSGGQCRFSGIPNGVGFDNLLTGARGVLSGIPVSGTFGPTGPGLNFTSNANVAFGGQSTINDVSATVAAIQTWTSSPASGQSWFDSSGASTSGFLCQAQSATNMRVSFPGGGVSLNPSGTTAIAINIPYFVVLSFVQSGSNFISNCLIINLNTGQITSATQTIASTGPVAPNGTYIIGNSAASFTPSKTAIAALMFSNNYLSMPQLTAWAYDPWSFWYPGAAENSTEI